LGAGAKVEDPPTGGDEIPQWRGKKCGKQLTHIVRVMGQALFICLVIRDLSWYVDQYLICYLSCRENFSCVGAREKILQLLVRFNLNLFAKL
jgi:hypothetical protein